jgi:membrane protease YdiL (CAAX protease family)
MELSPTRGQATGPSNRLVQLLRHHPLVSYFLLAFGFAWAYDLTVFRVLHPPSLPWGVLLFLGLTLGPTLAAFLMTAVMQGRAGILHLLRSYVLWRVGIPWYLLVLLGVPALGLLAVLLLPGGLSAFHLPELSFWPTFLIFYLITLVAGGPLFEEVGWRGFALPRLEQHSGPLVGTLILGVLWGLWHLLEFFIPGTTQYAISVVGTGFVGHLLAFGGFVIWTSALAVLFTWVFNNTRGSLLLAILLHASINAAYSFLLPPLFPSLAWTPQFFLSWILVWVVVALLIIAATRGRLSYQRYQRETALPAPVTDRGQEKGEARTSV